MTAPTGVVHKVGNVEEIPPGAGRAFAVAGEQVAIFRLRGGGLRAVSAVCPHAGGPIADGQADNEIVVCPLHQHAFDLATGGCRTGQQPLRTYDVSADADGALLVTLPGPA
jgi:nitrite reductase/ring-hydroxylating ferredoxin subunit